MPTLFLGIDARRATTGAGTFNKAIKSMVLALGGLAAARKIARTIMDFEDTMARLKGVTGATEAQMRHFNKTARELGATTRFTASQAAEGLLNLSRAGFTVEESNAAIAATLDLATAATIDLGEASEITATTIRQFGLEASDARRVADVLVNTANSANATIQTLAQAMGFAGTAAAAANVSLEETAAALGVLMDAGIKSSRAGMSLRQVMVRLVNPTAEATEQLTKMGLSLDDVDPTKKGVIGAFRALEEAQLDLSSAAKIFGSRQATSALVLTKAIEKMKELTAANEKNMGIARANAKLLEGTVRGAYLEFISSLQEATLQMGDAGLTGAMRKGLEVLTGIVRVFTGMENKVTKTFAQMELVVIKFFKHFKIGVNHLVGIGKTVMAIIKALFDGMVGIIAASFNLMLMDLKEKTRFAMEFVALALEEASKVATRADKDLARSLDDAAKGIRNAKLATSEWLDSFEKAFKTAQQVGDEFKNAVQSSRDEAKAANEIIQDAYAARRGELVKLINKLNAEETETKRVAAAHKEVAAAVKDEADATENLEVAYDGVGRAVGDALESMAFRAKNATEAINDMMRSITQMIFRQTITNPIAQAIAAAMGGGGGYAHPSGSGFTGTGPLRSFGNAKGNVISSPSMFASPGVGIGTMAESGPEAIMPLRRGPDGRLGVEGGAAGIVVNNYMSVSAMDSQSFEGFLYRNQGVLRTMSGMSAERRVRT